jgi:drug/metabolite transporter (DMT)-like permease
MPHNPSAVLRLLLATAAWGLSFSTAKAVMLAQSLAIPGREEWFHSALILFVRMALATLIMGLLYPREMRRMGRAELHQGILLGVFGGAGMLLQTDAQHVIPASTSAFFTQFTCIFVPVAVAFKDRRRPTFRVVSACLLVLAGCSILSGFSSTGLAFGRGEWETIGAAGLFTAQILVLEINAFRANEMRATAAVMFATKALVLLPLLLLGGGPHGGHPGGLALWVQVAGAFCTGPVFLMTALLTCFSTVYGYATMTRWQPLVSPVQAGLIYATEPIFATVWALFLPAWFSSLSGVSYPNESLTGTFLIGGFLILGANFLLLEKKSG